MVGPERSDDEAIAVIGDLANPEAAEQMNRFLVLSQTDSEYVSIAVFVIFALRYRLRVHAWFNLECDDLVA